MALTYTTSTTSNTITVNNWGPTQMWGPQSISIRYQGGPYHGKSAMVQAAFYQKIRVAKAAKVTPKVEYDDLFDAEPKPIPMQYGYYVVMPDQDSKKRYKAVWTGWNK